MEYQINDLIELFERDLNRLKTEVETISGKHLWEVPAGVANSCGVLSQHIVGNLKHYVGTVLGDTGFVRDREREFTNTGISADSLKVEIEETISMMHEVLAGLNENDLSSRYPLDVPFEGSVYQMLIHLYGHLNYHRGQVNYLRRLLTENKG